MPANNATETKGSCKRSNSQIFWGCLNTVSQLYQTNRDQLFYRINSFLIALSILVVTVIYAVNSDKIERYEDEMLWPFKILRVANTQIGFISNEKKIFSSDQVFFPEVKDTFHYFILADLTVLGNPKNSTSDELNSLIQKRSGQCFQYPVSDDIRNLRNEEKIMMLSFLNTGQYSKYYEGKFSVNIILYYGYPENDRSPVELVNNFEMKNCSEIVEHIRNARSVQNQMTDFSYIVRTLNTQIGAHAIKDNSKVVLTILSDFVHEESPKTATFEEAYEQIDQLGRERSIHQINLLKFPHLRQMKAASIEDKARELIHKFKQSQENVFLFELALGNNAGNELCADIDYNLAPISDFGSTKNQIDFYYPFSQTASQSLAKGGIRISEVEGSDQFYFSLHSLADRISGDIQLQYAGYENSNPEESSVKNKLVLNQEFAKVSSSKKFLDFTFSDKSRINPDNNLYLTFFPRKESGKPYLKQKVKINFKEKIPNNDAVFLAFFAALFLSSVMAFFLLWLCLLLFRTASFSCQRNKFVLALILQVLFVFIVIYKVLLPNAYDVMVSDSKLLILFCFPFLPILSFLFWFAKVKFSASSPVIGIG